VTNFNNEIYDFFTYGGGFMYETLLNLCKERGITITNLCIEITGSPGNLSTWKRGNIKADVICKIADYFHISTDYLLGRTDTPEENTINNHNTTITDSVQAIKSPVTINGKETKDSNDIMTQFLQAFSDLPFENKVAALNFILEMKKSA
jgi:transcriptional regulator with XRE-family HTH domain